MKRKIKITDKQTGATTEGEVEVRNIMHFEVQQKNRAQVFKNRKKYNRKEKHKKVFTD